MTQTSINDRRFTIRLTDADRRKLETAARRGKTSIGSVIRDLIRANSKRPRR
jgi:hypothetical protein